MVTLDKMEQGFKILLENSKTCSLVEFKDSNIYKLENIIVYSRNVIEDCSKYMIGEGDVLYQKSGLALKVLTLSIGENITYKVLNLESGIECYVPIYLLRKGAITENLFSYFSEKDLKYIVGEKVPLRNGGTAEIKKSYVKDVVIIDNNGKEHCGNRDKLLSTGEIVTTSTVVGRTVFQKQTKMYATCIEQLEGHRALIEFDNGKIKEDWKPTFSMGACVLERTKKDSSKKNLLGMTVTNLLGMKAVIIRVLDRGKVECAYEDGYIFTISYSIFKSGDFVRRGIEYRNLKIKNSASITYDSVWNVYIVHFSNNRTELLGHKPELSAYTITRKGRLLTYYYDRCNRKYIIFYEKRGMQYVDTQDVVF